jgi:hypothetical protein
MDLRPFGNSPEDVEAATGIRASTVRSLAKRGELEHYRGSQREIFLTYAQVALLVASRTSHASTQTDAQRHQQVTSRAAPAPQRAASA